MKRARIALAVGLLALAALVFSWTLGGWREFEIGGRPVRRHFITRAIQLKAGADWTNSVVDDPRAPLVPKADLKTVSLTDLAWGDNGMLIGRALTSNGKPIHGRLAFNLRVQEPNGTRVIGSGERSLRRAADWPEGTGTWFVLDTGLTTPDPRQKTTVTLESLE